MQTTSTSGIIASWVLFAALVAVGAVDLWLSYREPQGTVSALILDTSRRYPILPLAVGLLLGHLLWPQVVSVLVITAPVITQKPPDNVP
jgi:hypothetical protein